MLHGPFFFLPIVRLGCLVPISRVSIVCPRQRKRRASPAGPDPLPTFHASDPQAEADHCAAHKDRHRTDSQPHFHHPLLSHRCAYFTTEDYLYNVHYNNNARLESLPYKTPGIQDHGNVLMSMRLSVLGSHGNDPFCDIKVSEQICLLDSRVSKAYCIEYFKAEGDRLRVRSTIERIHSLRNLVGKQDKRNANNPIIP